MVHLYSTNQNLSGTINLLFWLYVCVYVYVFSIWNPVSAGVMVANPSTTIDANAANDVAPIRFDDNDQTFTNLLIT